MLKSNFRLKLGLTIIVILTIGLFSIARKEYGLFLKEPSFPENTDEQPLVDATKEEVIYIINKGERGANSYKISITDNSTVFSLLEELAKNESFEIETKIYKGMGVFVESIDGLKNGTDNKYWQYWVNDELPMVAVDKKNLKIGDKVEWKFAPFSF